MKKTVALFLILFLVILKSGAQCFTPVYEGNGVDHMNFYFTGATVNGVNLQPGDEIGVFDGELCVGRATLTQVLTGGALLPVPASADDNTTPAIDGYTVGHAVTYRLCSGGTVITNVNATYLSGTGVFAVGATAQVTLAGITECTNPPALTLYATTGSGCPGTPVTVSGNTFGGSATSVSITTNGHGALSPSAASTSPFSFSYTPHASDAGQTVLIVVTTDNPEGAPCTPASSTYSLTVDRLPGSAGTITGTSSVCQGRSGVTYSVPAIPDADSYEWVYTGNEASITGTTASVTINFGNNATSGNLTVRGVNDCGNGPLSTAFPITVNPLPSTGNITGNATPACGAIGIVYSVTGLAGSTYAWSVPTGANIFSGQGTNSITVNFGQSNGNITVTETSAAGCVGPQRTLAITLQGCGLNADFTAEPRTLCAGSSVVFSNTSLGTTGNTTFAWNFGDGATPATASAAGPHTVTYNTGGSKTVSLTITDGASDTETKTGYITVNPLPAAAGTITGTPSVCRGSSNVSYSVPVISGATSYSWVYSGQGATISGTTNTVTINFSASATSGTLTVRGVNSCGNGTLSQGYAITVNLLPPAPGVGEITHPTCAVATGSVVLTGLPAGNWTVNPGGITGSTPTVTMSGLASGTHRFTVTNSYGCTSEESAAIVINARPAIPTAPVIGAVTQPTCAISTGSVGISGLPSTGTWILTRNPGGAQVSGTGTTFTVSGLEAGTYTYTVTGASGCVSPASNPFTINSPPPVPAVPVVSVNCDGGFNHAIVTVTSPSGAGLEYRLNSGAWQESNVFNNVVNGNHRVTVRNTAGCTATTPEFSVNCGCVNPPLLTLSATMGSTCGIAPVTISGNTFGGSASSVTITENGAGSVSPGSSGVSPFSFTYTPASGDAGRTVVITVTTDNPLGSPCAAASATYTLTVNALPAAPVRGTVTHPTCVLPTGSVVLNSLPATGEWMVTCTPGDQTTTGSGTSATITGLLPGTYTFRVTDANGCVSPSSGNVVINAQPATPSAPVVGTITQPTCAQSTGSVQLSGLPATGSWTLTRSPGNLTIPGSGTTRTVSNIPPGTFTFTVTNAAGCVSPASDEIVIEQQPNIPVAPVIGNITHPTCELATGTVVLENLPENGEWVLIRYPGGSTLTGTGSSATISSLPPGVYNFAVTNAEQCTSPVSGNAVINAQPPIPNAPVVGTITHPTFQVATGSVVLSGLPSPGSWTLIRYPDQFTSQGTGTARTVSGLLPGTYTFAVTNSYGCTSEQTGQVVINARPGAPRVIINNPPVICENETTDLTDPAVTAGSDPNLTFTYWTDAEATEAYTTPQAAPAGIYYIMGTSTAGYYSIRPVVVTADQLPVANAGPDTVLHYVFRTTLNAEIPAIGTGIWELVTGTGDIFDPAAPSTHVSGLSVGENVFSWSVTNGACDPVTDLMVVRVNNLTIPTLITPNEDGRNDFFEIRGLDETLGTTELTIFDRRGLKVYENNNYTNDEGNRWEGRDYNGNPLPEDTYFYVIRAANGVSISGYVVVRR